jgi:Siphovirus-type tail component, C-terminal domain
MASIGDYTFDESATRIVSDLRMVEKRLRREISIVGMLEGFVSASALYSEMEALEKEIEKFAVGEVTLSLVSGRFLNGKILRHRKTVDEAQRVASFRLILLSEDRFERSIEFHQETLIITASGNDIEVENAGSADSLPTLTLTATGELVDPAISDGTNTLSWSGTLSAGDTLVLDCDAHRAIKNGSENVLASMSGQWPTLPPGETTLTYSDDISSSHSASLVVGYYDFWA